jgi:hypothetical protein
MAEQELPVATEDGAPELRPSSANEPGAAEVAEVERGCACRRCRCPLRASPV